MSGAGSDHFVQRSAYRRRRLADAARLLPLFGAALVLIPLLWQGAGGDGVPGGARSGAPEEGARTSLVMSYLFAVWLGLTVASGLLSRVLGEGPAAQGEDEDGDGAC